MARILVTGAAGFVGFHLGRRLLDDGHGVIGVDSLNAYYDPALKQARLNILQALPGFAFHHLDLADRDACARLFATEDFGPVAHLAAQAGVRHSLEHPHAYADANLSGFLNILEGCRQRRTPHLLFASSSSVYGLNSRMPLSVHDNVDHPVSLYAATKKANEAMAHAYSHLYRLPATGLRFFTVYGPWGRPDMAPDIFSRAILAGEPIRLFNHGRVSRDFTFCDDVVEAIVRLLDRPPQGNSAWSGDKPDPASSPAPWRLYNIGCGQPVDVGRFVSLLEAAFGRTAVKELVPMQPGDVETTCADIDDLAQAIGFRPAVSIEEGVTRFVAWYRDYYA